MRILAIETSCDETAISIVTAEGGFERPVFKVEAHVIASQIDIHQVWGGVVPSIAKREHGRALLPLLIEALKTSGSYLRAETSSSSINFKADILEILDREPELRASFWREISPLSPPNIDAIAVTEGPGLEPALWVGINFAKALSLLWQKPLIPVNHMEGHLFSSLLSNEEEIKFPAVALLASGGHTEIILVEEWLKYKVIGRTRDDAVGEAFDKAARILGLPYPGGPEISKLAEEYENERDQNPVPEKYRLPRPMISSKDFDFSYSGLKTAVLYLTKKIDPLSEDDRKIIAYEFQAAAIDVLVSKTLGAIEKYSAKTAIVGGGVIANKKLQRRLSQELADRHPETKLLLPDLKLSTDNATMIAIAGYFNTLKNSYVINPEIKARGNLSL